MTEPNKETVNKAALKKALKELKQRNKELRDSFRLTPEKMNFKCYPK